MYDETGADKVQRRENETGNELRGDREEKGG